MKPLITANEPFINGGVPTELERKRTQVLLVSAGFGLLGVWSDLLRHLGGGGRPVLHGVHHVSVCHLHRPLRRRTIPAAVPDHRHREAGAAGHAGRLDPRHRHLHRPAAGLEAAAVAGTEPSTSPSCSVFICPLNL